MQILLVEDDLALSKALQVALSKQGHSVNAVTTGADALHVIHTEVPDIVILDLGLPDMDGVNVLKKIRQSQQHLAILILTARAELEDRITGLDNGADDYLAKPFEMTELLARLRVLERRLSTNNTALITINHVTLNINNNSVIVNGDELELSRREYMLLKSLMENSGKVLTRNTLETRLYSWGEEVSSNALEVHIHHLRKKLGTDFIKTIRGVGYKVNTA